MNSGAHPGGGGGGLLVLRGVQLTQRPRVEEAWHDVLAAGDEQHDEERKRDAHSTRPRDAPHRAQVRGLQRGEQHDVAEGHRLEVHRVLLLQHLNPARMHAHHAYLSLIHI